jgi:hypothetical protein
VPEGLDRLPFKIFNFTMTPGPLVMNLTPRAAD